MWKALDEKVLLCMLCGYAITATLGMDIVLHVELMFLHMQLTTRPSNNLKNDATFKDEPAPHYSVCHTQLGSNFEFTVLLLVLLLVQ